MLVKPTRSVRKDRGFAKTSPLIYQSFSESIADYTEQPLLSLSGCDIGSTENSETQVQYWFDLAKAWDALILIDEADIFLTWRQPDNLERNILVTSE